MPKRIQVAPHPSVDELERQYRRLSDTLCGPKMNIRSLWMRWARKANNRLALIQFASALVLWRMANEP